MFVDVINKAFYAIGNPEDAQVYFKNAQVIV
jgi:hypothetical protein